MRNSTPLMLLVVVMMVVMMVMQSCGTVESSRLEAGRQGRGRRAAAAARARRETVSTTSPTPIYVDVLVVTDYQLFQQWKNRNSNNASLAREKMREYYTLVMKGVNRIYRTLETSGMDISVLLSALHISESATESSWTEESLLTNAVLGAKVNASAALEKLQTWVRTTKNYSRYDHVVLFTGHDMLPDTGNFADPITGKAYQNRLCAKDGSSLSIVLDSGAFQSVLISAHELGHSFGALHDGEVAGCSDSDRYLMAKLSFQTDEGNTHPWRFSNCSQAALANFTRHAMEDSQMRACLLENFGPGQTLPQEAGQVYSPDELCRQLLGPNSYYCRSTKTANSSTICTALPCYNSSNPRVCSHFVAADGTSCGDKKWCNAGECVESSEAPSKNASCLFGDTPYPPEGRRMSCSMTVQQFPWRCYDPVFKENCCQSCTNTHSGNDACPWGDERMGCTQQACSKMDRHGNIASLGCCQTCSCTGESCLCQDRHDDCSRLTHPGKCYNESLAFLCCQTCSELRTGRSGCEFGDYFTEAECQRAAGRGNVDRNTASLCCSTCNTSLVVSGGPVVCQYQPSGQDVAAPALAQLLLLLLVPLVLLANLQ